MSKLKINVGFVLPPLVGHQKRGIGHYYRALLQELKKRPDLAVEEINIGDYVGTYDLIHYPYFDPFFLTLPLVKIKPIVVTVHDLIPLKYPKYFPTGFKGMLKFSLQRYSLLASRRVMTDSLSSKNDIIKFIGVDKKKIDVIALGVSDDFKAFENKEDLRRSLKLNLPDEFILCVGDVNYNKNISSLIRAFSLVNKKINKIHLVLVGAGFINKSKPRDELISLIKSLDLTDKVHLIGDLALSDLVATYNLAKLYIQPSLAEGFGLPVLEAMACGCPVISSDRSSLKEITADAAYGINPQNINDMASAMVTIYQNQDRTDELIILGLENAKKYSWDKCAQQTVDVYKKIIS